MGTPGSGRKRTPVKDRFSAEDEALSNIAREAEARLAAKRAARAEARDIRMRELERQQKEHSHHSFDRKWGQIHKWLEDSERARYSHQSSHHRPYLEVESTLSLRSPGSHRLDEKSDKQYAENYTRPSSRNSASATTPLSGNSSRRGSGDTSSLIDPDTSLSELRESLSEVEEKYKKAMVSNAQLDNEKNNLIYQVDTLKDVIEEQEEQMAEFYRENEEKSKELERQKHMCSVLQHKMDELKEGLRQRDELIEKHGLVIIPDGTPNGDVSHEPVVGAITVVSQEAAQVLESAGEGPLDVRLRKLAGEKEELLSQIRKLKLQLEEERQKCSRNDGTAGDLAGLQNGSDLQFIEMQRDANRQISEYKFKLSKAEQDITTLEQSISRLEGQVLRYKTAAENAEKVEDELKAEKRKLQRELRTALDKIEEMEMTNSHLAKRLEKMKANRTALLAQQ
ncbi:PREDICTED: leucine-rich repeat flightless-interacting protein 2 isoform X11 [Chinchilla lanigera]|uniref:leucine-rich repeat flightless-interacting protein 2 isoform X11 n=1 Tax=Chinchilla lanigera TaxID=34839 RepID=UPI000696A758|nr:PREDICTED: leucine-rich repeat flightless-interacting protein 2 isoform X11 [Chinchilla lanigera]